MKELPKTFEQAVIELDRILTNEQKKELKNLPFISSNVKDETDFFSLVVSSFELEGGNDGLLVDIAHKNKGKPVSNDFLKGDDIADSINGARLILEKLKHDYDSGDI
jgi:hypothetical protein